eukprot:scpid96756/ scgid8670/ 
MVRAVCLLKLHAPPYITGSSDCSPTSPAAASCKACSKLAVGKQGTHHTLLKLHCGHSGFRRHRSGPESGSNNLARERQQRPALALVIQYSTTSAIVECLEPSWSKPCQIMGSVYF